MEDRRVRLTLKGEEYVLVFTMSAMKAVAGKYGDIEKMFDFFASDADITEKMDGYIWLFSMMAEKGKAATGEGTCIQVKEMEEKMTPAEILRAGNAACSAITLGMQRDVMGDEKNGVAGRTPGP